MPLNGTRVRRALSLPSTALVVAFAARATSAGALPRQPAPCAGSVEEAATPRISLEADAAAPGDSRRTVHVCIRASRGTLVGSFHLVVEYDSSAWETVGFVPGATGSQVANLTRMGRADIAGAAPGGFASGTLLRLVFAPSAGRRAGEALGIMNLRLLELNSTDGSNLMTRSTVSGLAGLTLQRHSAQAPLPSTPPAKAPHIDRLEPARATRRAGCSGSSHDISGRGSGPRATSCCLRGVVIGELPSADGLRLRLVLPETFPPVGEVPPRRLLPGVYDIRVRTGAGTSNPMQLVLEMPR